MGPKTSKINEELFLARFVLPYDLVSYHRMLMSSARVWMWCWFDVGVCGGAGGALACRGGGVLWVWGWCVVGV